MVRNSRVFRLEPELPPEPSATFEDDETSALEPLAIIGLGCVTPGAANLRCYWANLLAGEPAESGLELSEEPLVFAQTAAEGALQDGGYSSDSELRRLRTGLFLGASFGDDFALELGGGLGLGALQLSDRVFSDALRRALSDLQSGGCELALCGGSMPKDGFGMVLLKRLSQAHRDGDRIRATLCLGAGESAEPDGAGEARAELLEEASVPGLLTTVLALYHKVLPPGVGEDSGRQEARRPWPSTLGRSRRAELREGAFRAALLEEEDARMPGIDWPGHVQILALGADTRAELEEALANIPDDEPWPSLCHRTAASRESFCYADFRLILVLERGGPPVAEVLAQARAKLAAAQDKAAWSSPGGAFFGSATADDGLALIFPGVGVKAQRILLDLACHFPRAQELYFASGLGLSSDGLLSETRLLRCTLGLVLQELLSGFGLRAQAYAGEGAGELAALCAAGRLRLDQVFSICRASVLDRSNIDDFFDSPTSEPSSFEPLAGAQRFLAPGDGCSVYSFESAELYPETGITVGGIPTREKVSQEQRIALFRALAADGIGGFVELGAGGLRGIVQSELGVREHGALSVAPRPRGEDTGASETSPRDGFVVVARLLAALAADGRPLALRNWDPAPAPAASPNRLGRPKPGVMSVISESSLPSPKRLLSSAEPLIRAAPSLYEEEGTPTIVGGSPAEFQDAPTFISSAPSKAPIRPPNPAPSPFAAPASLGAEGLEKALAMIADSMNRLQQIQHQTAELHKQFLDGQERAQQTFHMLAEQQEQLLRGVLGAPLGLPPSPSSFSPGPENIAGRTVQVSPPARPSGAFPVLPFPQSGLRAGDESPTVQVVSGEMPIPPSLSIPDDQSETDVLKGSILGGTTRAPKDELTESLFAVVSERSGTPTGELDLKTSLKDDLGFDTRQRSELLVALRERLPKLFVLGAETPESLGTLGDVVAYFSADRSQERTLAVREQASPSAKLSPAPKGIERSLLSTLKVELEGRDSLPFPAAGVFAIVGDGGGLAEPLAIRLQDLGHEVLRLPIGTGLALPDVLNGLVILAPPRGADDALIKAAFETLQSAASRLRRGHAAGGALLATVSRLDGAFGLRSLDEGHSALAGALSGLTKAAAREWVNVACRALDLDRGADSSTGATLLADELLREGPVELGLSAAERVTPILEAEKLEPTSPLELEAGALIVASGGARGVTAHALLSLAEQLLDPCFLLLGRSPAPETEPAWLTELNGESEIKRALLAQGNGRSDPSLLAEQYQSLAANREMLRNIRRLEEAGARVIYHSVDVRDADAVALAVQEARGIVGPIRGLIHGAGVLAEGRIEDLSREDFDRVYDTKVAGLRALLAATRQDSLRFLALFSSASARFGRARQAAYCAADEVLNKIAQQESRIRAGCRVVALGWGPWDGGLVTQTLKALYAREGIQSIGLNAGAQAFIAELALPPSPDAPTEVLLLGAGSRLPAALGAGPQPTIALPSERLSLVFERQVDVASHPILADHVIDSRAVLPLSLILEWMAQAALEHNPGLRFKGCVDLRILEPITLAADESVSLRIYAGKARRSEGLDQSPVELRVLGSDGLEGLRARAEMSLGEEPPEAEPPRLKSVPKGSPISAAEAYESRLFYGPRLRLIEEIEGLDSDGISVLLSPSPHPSTWMERPSRSSWIADPGALEAAFQALTIWSFERHDRGSLPLFGGRLRLFLEAFPSAGLRVIARVVYESEAEAVVDLEFVDSEGKLVARLDGYECRADASLESAFRRNRLDETAVRNGEG